VEKRKNIGELLIEYGKISEKDLEEALKLQKEFKLRVGETLIKLGKITHDDIEWVLSKQLDIPFVIVEDVSLDHILLFKFQKYFLMKNRILPLYETDDEIAIATDDPLNKEALDVITKISGKKINLSSGNGEKIEEILTQFYRKDSVSGLREKIRDVIEKIKGTSFYRIDFICRENNCEISVFGYNILKNIVSINDTFKKEHVFKVFDSLDISFLYDEYSNGKTVFLSIYPMINKIEDIHFPAILGVYGLFLPEYIMFADSLSTALPSVLPSEKPVKPYPFLSTKKKDLSYERTIFTIDSAPEHFRDFYVQLSVPRLCDICNGLGCVTCNDLGYLFTKMIDGIYSSEQFNTKVNEVRGWQR
jgi:type IV pilus assembly protein PilB